jgi:hypothetical protein
MCLPRPPQLLFNAEVPVRYFLRRLLVCSALLAPLAGVPSHASAQSRAVLAGRVIDDATGSGVSGARVELLSAVGAPRASTVTDSAGHFEFSAASGRYRLRAVDAGFDQVVTGVIEATAGEQLQLVLRLNREVFALPALEVLARVGTRYRYAGLAAFEIRMAQGLGGTFITREQLEARSPRRLSDMLPEAGMTVWGDGISEGGIFTSRRGCAPMVYLDGVPLTVHGFGGGGRPRRSTDTPEFRALEAVNLVDPASVEAVEVYRGAATLPAEFGGSTGGCGAIAIWTRRG